MYIIFIRSRENEMELSCPSHIPFLPGYPSNKDYYENMHIVQTQTISDPVLSSHDPFPVVIQPLLYGVAQEQQQFPDIQQHTEVVTHPSSAQPTGVHLPLIHYTL